MWPYSGREDVRRWETGKHKINQHRCPERYTYAERNALPRDIQQGRELFLIQGKQRYKFKIEGAQLIGTNLVSSFITTLIGQGPFIDEHLENVAY